MLSLDVFIPWWLLDGDSLVFSHLVSTIVTPAWGLVFPELTMSFFFLLNGKYWLPTSSLTLLTKPSLSGRALITWQTFHWFQGVSSSLMMRTSFTWRFFLVWVHFCLSCRGRGNSFFHLQQNSLVRCCTCRHHFLAYRSADLNTPGGDRTTFVFNLRKWFGVSASVEPGDDMLSAVYGRLLTMASASHMKVCKAS